MHQAAKTTSAEAKVLSDFYTLASTVVPGRDVAERVANFDSSRLIDILWLWWDVRGQTNWLAENWPVVSYEMRMTAREMVAFHLHEPPTPHLRWLTLFRRPGEYLRLAIRNALGDSTARHIVRQLGPRIAEDDKRAAEAWGRIEARAPDFAKRVRAKPQSAFDPALVVDSDENDC
jgi:hypothetical protein